MPVRARARVVPPFPLLVPVSRLNLFRGCILPLYFLGLETGTSRGKGGTTRARAHRHACTLPNPEALGPDIEEGAVNQRPLQALFLLPWGGARPTAGPGAILLQPTNYVRGVGLLRKLRPSAVAIGCPISCGLATK